MTWRKEGNPEGAFDAPLDAPRDMPGRETRRHDAATSRVRQLGPDDLPRVARGADDVTRRLARLRARFPASVTVDLRGIGPITLLAERMASGPDGRGVAGDESCEALVLEHDGRHGRLLVDRDLALRLVGVVLGTGPPVGLRSLGAAERGVLAAIAASVIDELGRGFAVPFRLSLDARALDDPARLTTIDLRVSASGRFGWIRLEFPSDWLPSFPAGPVQARGLEVWVSIEVARTALPAGELAAAEVGDAIVFGGVSAVDINELAACPGLLRLGSHALAIQIHSDGSLGPASGAQWGQWDMEAGEIMRSENETSESGPARSTKDTGPSGALAQAIAAAPVEIVAELGRVSVRSDELAGLMIGGVLQLGSARPRKVDLRVAGRLWGQGELVTVDGELGVRIVEIL